MCTMKWKEVVPEQDDWEKQIDIVAYYGSITVGSIVYCGEEIGWQSVIDGHMNFMQAESSRYGERTLYCNAPGIGDDVTDYIACRPDWCPLRELPQKQ